MLGSPVGGLVRQGQIPQLRSRQWRDMVCGAGCAEQGSTCINPVQVDSYTDICYTYKTYFCVYIYTYV